MNSSVGARLIYRHRRVVGAAMLTCFLLACTRYAYVQDIWIDESTQLSGVRLSVSDLLRWLAGTDTGRFGVPGDRMPPLAYLVDHLWWLVAGDRAFPFRTFHILIAAAGVTLFASCEIKTLGVRWRGVGLAFLVFSPKLIDAAGELRSYPLFFAATCAVLLLFLGMIRPTRTTVGWSQLLVFSGACYVISYIHFFGVVASFAFFATLLLVFVRERTSLLRVTVVGALFSLGLIGLYPFIFGATSVSGVGTAARVSDIVHYLPSLIGHPALLIYQSAALLFFAGAAALLLAASYGALSRALRSAIEPLDWLVVVAAIGAGATIAPAFVVTTFETLKASYSIWLLPVFALLIASGASRTVGWNIWDRYVRIAATAALLIGGATGTLAFLVHASWFIHGPHRVIEAARAISPEPSAILYATPNNYAIGYFPMVYQTAGFVPQWVWRANGVVRLPETSASQTRPPAVLSDYRSLIVVDIQTRHFSDLRHCLQKNCPTFVLASAVGKLVGSGRWSIITSSRTFGFYDAVITRLSAKRMP